MGNFSIKKGRDIHLKGGAKKEIVEISSLKHVAVQPQDFRGIRPRLLVKVNDAVKAGTPVMADKNVPEITVAAPVSGKVAAINRGDKRALLSIVIEADGRQSVESFQKFTSKQILGITPKHVTEALLKGSLWPVIRQRPFSTVADPHKKPKSIFIHAVNTEPLAGDIDFILDGKEKEFQVGLDVIKHLTDGDVHVCYRQGASCAALTQAKRVKTHTFNGPHPSGNVSTHIHRVDPINKGDIVWYIEAQDVLRVANLFLNGAYPSERIVAVTGEGAQGSQAYVKTVIGAPVKELLGGKISEGMRFISGSILNGKNVGPDGFICYYDSQLSVIPEGGNREFLGWLSPGADKYSFSKTFLSSFTPDREVSLDCDEHGSHRAIVLNNLYDTLVPLDIMTYFLLKAVLAGDVDEAEQLGILECDEEDFALCSFACPSKTDVGGIIRKGLDQIQKEE